MMDMIFQSGKISSHNKTIWELLIFDYLNISSYIVTVFHSYQQLLIPFIGENNTHVLRKNKLPREQVKIKKKNKQVKWS